MENALILCSGGLDSVVTSYYAKSLGYKKIKILFFNYKQKSLKAERKKSKLCAKKLNAKFIEIKLKWLSQISHSLINKPGKISKIKNLKDTKKESDKYYVPCRNTIFLSYALALAESLYFKEKEKYDIFVGFKNEGKESYPDTTKEFVSSINQLSKTATAGFKLIAPLIEKDKEDIILLGKKLGVDFKETHSCYLKNKHCGKCLACELRKAGFYWSGEKDVTRYSEK